MDASVLALGYSYNALSLPYQQTSYSDAAATTTVNQVRDVYNGLQQIVGQYQEHFGAVNTSTTPQVQYGYSSIASGSNLVSMTYPNGRILHYGYDNNALDTAIGRVDYLADDNGSGSAGSHLADFSYLGLSSILGQADGNGVTLTETLDSLGRIADMNWLNTATSTSTDHFQYGYDRNGNVLYKNNLVNSAFSELYHANSSATGDNNSAYDPLNRLTGFSRGTLSSSGNNGANLDTVTTLNSTSGLSGNQQSWSLDAVGNQTSVTTDGTATGRTANSQNELTGVGTSTLTYDNNGNTTTDENGNTLTYDAWNRMVSDSAGSTTYSFDANGWRTAETHATTTTNLYFTTQGQVVEERVSGTVTAQNVWSIDYINDLLLRDGTSGRTYYQHDASFSVTATLSTTGIVESRNIFTSYGIQTMLTETWAISAGGYTTYGFQGGRFDAANGTYHFGARDYEPSLATWIEKDPADYINGASTYQFVISNPLIYTDATGLDTATQPSRPLPVDPVEHSNPVHLPDVKVDMNGDFWNKFYDSANWGNTQPTWRDNGDGTSEATGIHTVLHELQPPTTLKCPNKDEALTKAIKEFNDAALKHEQDVQDWFNRETPRGSVTAAQKKAFADKAAAQWGNKSPDEISAQITLYEKLQAAYNASRCENTPPDDNIDFDAKIRGLKNRLKRLQGKGR